MGRLKVALVSIHYPKVPDGLQEWLEQENVDLVIHNCATGEELLRYGTDADLLWINSGSRILSKELLARLPRCSAIVRTGSGTDNIPVDEATRLGIIVANTPYILGDYVSDHAMGLLLALVRKIVVHDRSVREGVWNVGNGRPTLHLRGRTLGIVGFGHIGRTLARKVETWEFTTLVHDPFVKPEEIEKAGAQAADLDDLLSQSDFVSLHCPLLENTYHLIGERELRMMKVTAILINTSRGQVVDEPALVRALSEGWITGAGLDVLEQEPPEPDHPLFALDNVIITPHTAAHCDQFWLDGYDASLEAIADIAKGRWPRSVVNRRQVQPRLDLAD